MTRSTDGAEAAPTGAPGAAGTLTSAPMSKPLASPTLQTPQAHVARVARAHDENFPVVFALLDRERRADMRAIYAFCRTVDDLGDRAPGDRLAAIEAFAADLERCWGGQPDDPVLRALALTVRRRQLAPGPFTRLIEANRMDQACRRYGTYAQLLDYCRRSATPVGAMVLGVLGCDDDRRRELSDHTCIGLQLVNFWQDIRRDLANNDRIYLPAEDMARFGVTEADLRAPQAAAPVRELVRFEVARARAELLAGAPLARTVPWRARLDLRMFTAGGLAMCDAIAAQDYDTLSARPAPGRLGRARIAAGVVAHLLRGGR